MSDLRMTRAAARGGAPTGFTLIELMIVVAIIAILAAVAYPAYTQSVARSRRADAKAVLLEAAQWIERQYSVSGVYDKLGDGTALNTAALPAQLKQAPKPPANKGYDLSFTAAPTAAAFTLQAVPTAFMTNDKCGTFTLTSTGVKGLSGNTFTVSECWDR